MKVGDRIRMAIRTFLRIDPAPSQTINIREGLDFQGNAIQHRLWYRGEAGELSAFYKQIGDQSAVRFWAAVPTKGLEVRKCHTGLPRRIVDTLAGVVLPDLNKIKLGDNAQQDRWDDIARENHFLALLDRALTGAMVIGDGAFKISLDPKLSKLPILEWYDGDKVEFKSKRGRIHEVIFTTPYDKYTLEEHYGFGYVHYRLFKGDQELDNAAVAEITGLQDVAFDPSYMMAVPFRPRASQRWPGRGDSFFQGKTDAFDALDEAWSQWVEAMREARPRMYIPSNLLSRDEQTGVPKRLNSFDNQYIKIEADMREAARNEISLQQAAFYAEQYNQTYMTALDLALQGLISPSTLGIDTKKLDNAEAQREKEKTTLYTRQKLIDALTDALCELIQTVFKVLDTMERRAPKEVKVEVTFGEYANPSFEAVVETLSNPNTPMSIEAKVDELWGDGKDEDWKKAEVQRIYQEQGLAAVEEPAAAADLEL